MKVSLCPSFYCNFRCPWCYLSTEQLSSRQIVDLKTLTNTLSIIDNYEQITHIDIYGGEPTLLPFNWSIELVDILRSNTKATINIITNLSTINHPLLFLTDTVGISYDFDKREQYEKVRENIRVFPRKKHIITLINQLHHLNHIDAYIEELTSLRIDSWELKPFSVSKYNNMFIEDFNMFENFVKTVIEKECFFEIINEKNIINKTNSFSNDHIYILPDGKMYVLDFNEQKEYFRLVNNIQEYIEWTINEHTLFTTDVLCVNCQYNGKCLSEHLKVYDNTCNGFPNLIKWYNERN